MSIRLLFLSDSHLFQSPDQELFGSNSMEGLKVVSGHIRRHEQPFDLLVALGDLSQDGSPESYRFFHSLTGGLAREAVWVPGNHDDFAGLAPDLQPLFKKEWHLGVWHLLFLDSRVEGKNGGRLGREETERLRNFLKDNRGGNILFCLHHQPADVGSQFIDRQGLGDREAFWEVLRGHREVKGVVFGHVHQVVDRQEKGCRILSVPATSVPFKPNSEQFALDIPMRGYRTVTLSPEGRLETAVHMIREEGWKISAPD